jgi:hypothetical protein
MTGVRFPAGAKIFFSLPPRPDRLWGLPSLLSVGTGAPSPRVKCTGRKAVHSPPFSADVKNVWSCISSHPYISMAWHFVKQGKNFTFLPYSSLMRHQVWRNAGNGLKMTRYLPERYKSLHCSVWPSPRCRGVTGSLLFTWSLDTELYCVCIAYCVECASTIQLSVRIKPRGYWQPFRVSTVETGAMQHLHRYYPKF